MKAKKILAGACASLMLAMTTVPVVSAAEKVTVTVGNTTAKAGESFSVTIDLEDIPAAGINGCDFGIEYDSSALTITDVKAGDLAKEDGAALEGVSALETNLEDGLVSIIYGLGTNETSNYMTGSGTFVTLEGTVDASAAAGKYDLDIVAVDRLANPSGTATNDEIIFGNLADDLSYTVYDATIVNGYVEVTSDTTEEQPTTGDTTQPSIGTATKIGDADCDGSVAIGDLVAVAKYVISPTLYPLTAEGLANADVNADKDINSIDTSKLIEYLTKQISAL